MLVGESGSERRGEAMASVTLEIKRGKDGMYRISCVMRGGLKSNDALAADMIRQAKIAMEKVGYRVSS